MEALKNWHEHQPLFSKAILVIINHTKVQSTLDISTLEILTAKEI